MKIKVILISEEYSRYCILLLYVVYGENGDANKYEKDKFFNKLYRMKEYSSFG